MFGDVDDGFMDLNFGSSPVTNHGDDMNSMGYGISTYSPSRYADLPEYDNTGYPYPDNSFVNQMPQYMEHVPIKAAPKTEQKKIKRATTPKASKRQPLIFHPFASFDATESTVHTLKECISKQANYRPTKCKTPI